MSQDIREFESHTLRRTGQTNIAAMHIRPIQTAELEAVRDLLVRGVSGFYEKLGFSVSQVAMERTRDREP